MRGCRFNPSGEINSRGTLSRLWPATEKISAPLFLFFLMIQLIASAPSVSNFASYSGVLTVTVRWGAAFTLGVATGAGVAVGVVEAAVCDAVPLAAGEGVAAAFGFAGGGTGEK